MYKIIHQRRVVAVKNCFENDVKQQSAKGDKLVMRLGRKVTLASDRLIEIIAFRHVDSLSSGKTGWSFICRNRCRNPRATSRRGDQMEVKVLMVGNWKIRGLCHKCLDLFFFWGHFCQVFGARGV